MSGPLNRTQTPPKQPALWTPPSWIRPGTSCCLLCALRHCEESNHVRAGCVSALSTMNYRRPCMHLPAGTHDGTVSADVPSSPLTVSRYPPFCGCQQKEGVKRHVAPYILHVKKQIWQGIPVNHPRVGCTRTSSDSIGRLVMAPSFPRLS